MTWPFEIPFSAESAVAGSVFGRSFSIVAGGPATTLTFGDEQWRAALPAGVHHLRFGPSLGPLPFLLFGSPSLIVPSGALLPCTFEVPLHLDVAGVADRSARVREIKPAGLTRSLYGPVDGGTLCWTIRSVDAPNLSFTLDELAARLAAKVLVTIENRADEPHEVSKVMIPVDMIGLYQSDDGLRLSDVQMTITGDSTAELTMESPTKARPLPDVTGQPMQPSRRTLSFSHQYRNRTGLDYGF